MTREQLTKILEKARGKKEQVPNSKAFQEAWKAAALPTSSQNGGKRGIEKEIPLGFEEYKKRHPDYFPEDVPLEKQIEVYLSFTAKQREARQQKEEQLHKLDQAVEQKTTQRAERKRRDFIEQEADQVLREGDPIGFIQEQFSKIHIGDEVIFLGLLASIGSQLCRPSEGIQPGLTGESGKGKTDACRALFHLLPGEYKMRGSFSNKSLFYHLTKPGTILFFDDAARLSEEMQDMIKQTTSAFQEPFLHRTVDRGKPETHELPPRLVFWITSVGGNYQLQFLNRQMNLSVDDSINQDTRVMSVTLDRYQQGDDRFTETEEVLICREVIKILKDQGPITVKIPFTDKIKWSQPKNRRNLPMFLDTVNAFAAIRQMQRERDPSGAVIATMQDFTIARDIWGQIAQEQVGKLSKDDRRLVDCIIKNGKKDSETGFSSLPRSDAKRILGFTDRKMHLILNGNEGVGGMTEKLEGFEVEKGTKTVELPEGGRKTVHCDTLKYCGQLDTFGQFNDVVWLEKD